MKISRRGAASTLGAVVAGAFGGKAKAHVIDEEPFMIIIECHDGLSERGRGQIYDEWLSIMERYPQLKKIPSMIICGKVTIKTILADSSGRFAYEPTSATI